MRENSALGLSGAEYLASIYGTEADKNNCSFYLKIGCCRHGESCSRTHHKPVFSQAVLLEHFYQNPYVNPQAPDAFERSKYTDPEEQRFFEDFYEEVFAELERYGEIEEMQVCENLGEHMIGNVYVRFAKETDAQKCVDGVSDRWFNGNAIYARLTSATDYRAARCRQHDSLSCTKGAYCNFMHLKPIPADLRRRLFDSNASHRGYLQLSVGRNLLSRRRRNDDDYDSRRSSRRRY